MRTTIPAVCVTAVGLVLLGASPAAAFHGSAYTARGTAIVISDGTVYDAKVSWSGAFGLGGGSYDIEFRDPETQLLIHKNTVAGREEFSNLTFVDCVEFVDYYGYGVIGGPLNLWPIGPGPAPGPEPVPFSAPKDVDPLPPIASPLRFELWGWQHNDLCTGLAEMHYDGNYLDAFDLSLDVWGPPGG